MRADRKCVPSDRSTERLQQLRELGAEPFVADVTDASALIRAFNGAQAAYVIVPPDVRSEDVLGYSERVTDAIVAAIQKAEEGR